MWSWACPACQRQAHGAGDFLPVPVWLGEWKGSPEGQMWGVPRAWGSLHSEGGHMGGLGAPVTIADGYESVAKYSRLFNEAAHPCVALAMPSAV